MVLLLFKHVQNFLKKTGLRYWKVFIIFFRNSKPGINSSDCLIKIFGKIKDYCNGVRTIKSITPLVLWASDLKILLSTPVVSDCHPCVVVGQISLVILVKALKLPPETNRNLLQTHNREWVSLDDVKLLMGKVSAQPDPGTSQRYDVQEALEEDEKPNHRSCFCVCFRKLFHRNKGQSKKNTVESVQNNLQLKSTTMDKQNNQTANQHIKYMSADNVNINGTGNNSPTRLKYGKQQNRLSVDLLRTDSLVNKTRDARLSLENIRNNAEIFRIKSEDFYRFISDRESANSVKLLKYFEQDRGLLVLETNCSSGLVVVNICMQIGQLQQLQRDIHNGKLNKDLENILITEEVLTKIGARGVKLTTEIDKDEFDLAEQELS